MSFKEWLGAFKGCFYWADARTLHAINRVSDSRRTEFMLLLPLSNWRGIGLIRVTEPDDDCGPTVIEGHADRKSEEKRQARAGEEAK